MQKFIDFFEERKIKIDICVPYRGDFFTITKVRAQNSDGTEFVAEGVARRSLDKPDDEVASAISGGRAIKALYLKIKYHEAKEKLEGLFKKSGSRTREKIREELRLQEKHYKSFVQGHIHLLMG